MEHRLIEGVIEDINTQLAELRKDYNVKVGHLTSVVKELENGKRVWLTVAVEIVKK